MKKIRKETAGNKTTQVSRKMRYKKMAALAIAGVLATGTALTGCGKKNIDYSVDGESGNGGIQLYESGTPVREIQKILNIGSSGTVYRLLRRNGIALKSENKNNK